MNAAKRQDDRIKMNAMKSTAVFVLAIAGACFADTGGVSAVSGRRCSLDSFPAMENEADDTARIQRAIDANPSGVLFVPAGVYKVSSTLKVFNLCSIDMDKSAILRAVKEIPYVLHVAVYHEFNKLTKESDRRQDYNMFVRGGKIDGDGLASCMSIEGYCHFTLRDMTFMNGRKVGLMVDEKAGGYELVADNLYFKCVKPGLAGNVAIHTRGGDSHYTDCISVNYTIGFHLTNPNTGANRLTRCHVWGNLKEMLKDSIAFWIDGSNGNILRDCYADTAQTGFLVDGSCNRLLGCTFENNRRYGLDNITIIRHPRGRLLVSECNFGKPSQNFKVYDGCGSVVWRDITYLGFAPGDDCPGKLEYPQ